MIPENRGGWHREKEKSKIIRGHNWGCHSGQHALFNEVPQKHTESSQNWAPTGRRTEHSPCSLPPGGSLLLSSLRHPWPQGSPGAENKDMNYVWNQAVVSRVKMKASSELPSPVPVPGVPAFHRDTVGGDPSGTGAAGPKQEPEHLPGMSYHTHGSSAKIHSCLSHAGLAALPLKWKKSTPRPRLNWSKRKQAFCVGHATFENLVLKLEATALFIHPTTKKQSSAPGRGMAGLSAAGLFQAGSREWQLNA